MVQRYIKNLVIAGLLVISGILLDVFGLLDAETILAVARECSGQWWLVLVLILLQTVLFTFALAGSFFLWIVAPLYPPVTATFILTAGGTLGGISAYWFSRRLTSQWIVKIEHSRTYKLLQKQHNFFTLFALRVFPAFPHALINYSSGMLNVKRVPFIAAAISGISIKSFIYANVIYHATAQDSAGRLLNIYTYGPLILLSIVTLSGVYIRYRLEHRQAGRSSDNCKSKRPG